MIYSKYKKNFNLNFFKNLNNLRSLCFPHDIPTSILINLKNLSKIDIFPNFFTNEGLNILSDNLTHLTISRLKEHEEDFPEEIYSLTDDSYSRLTNLKYLAIHGDDD